MKAFEFKVLWKLVKLAVVGTLKTNEFKSGAWEPSEYDAAPVEWYRKCREEIDKCLKSKETIVDMDSLDPDFLYLIKNTNINDIHNDLEPSYALMKNEYSKLLKMSMDAANYGIFKLPEGSPSPEEYYKKMALCLLHRESLEKWIVGIYRDMIGKLTGGEDYKGDGTIQQLTINGDNNMVYNNSVVNNSEEQSETFAENIFNLYRRSFFMEDGLIGQFAYNKIEELKVRIAQCNSCEEMNIIRTDINIIGDAFIKRYLQNKLDDATVRLSDEEQIAFYQAKINELRNHQNE